MVFKKKNENNMDRKKIQEYPECGKVLNYLILLALFEHFHKK